MQDNQIQPIHLVAQELTEKTLELANFKIAYQQLHEECNELKKLKELVDSNKELKELVEELKAKEEK